jgi:hypothetical protein
MHEPHHERRLFWYLGRRRRTVEAEIDRVRTTPLPATISKEKSKSTKTAIGSCVERRTGARGSAVGSAIGV